MRAAGVIALAVAAAGTAHAEEPSPPSAGVNERLSEHDAALDDLDKQLAAVKSQVSSVGAGSTRFLVTGYGFAEYGNDFDASSFTAGFNPIFLWAVGERVFFEAELEIELEGGETALGLEYAHGVVVLLDDLTLGAGLFLSPVNVFSERYHAAWINKLPDAPLPFGHDGLLPGAELGVQLRGALALGGARLTYAAFVSNGARLETGEDDPEEAGNLMFDDNFSDINGGKAVGGRLGFLPIPSLEVGLAAEWADVGPEGTEFEGVDALLLSVDVAFTRDFDAVKGTLDARGQWVFSRVDDATYGDAEPFDNQRQGGYLQLAYRPSKVKSALVQRFELVARLDFLRGPEDAPEDIQQTRFTAGLDYWIGASTVLKAAYQFADRREGESQDSLLAQLGVGF